MNDGYALGVLHRGDRVLQAQFYLDVQLTGLLLLLPFLLPLDSLDTFYLRFQALYLFMGGDFLGAQRYVCVQFQSLLGYCGAFAQHKVTPFFDGRQLLQAGAAVDQALPNIAQPHLLGDGFLVLCRRAAAARLLLLLPLEADQV